MSAIFDYAFATWRECREEYGRLLEAQYDAAEAATNGNMLNNRGRAAGIAPESLFLGPRRRAEAYASEELLEHWRSSPRTTFAEFERQWWDS